MATETALTKRVKAALKRVLAEDDPKLYLSRSTNDKGTLVWTVIYQGQPLMAENPDKDKALKVLEITEKEKKKKADKVWDGDLGKFVDFRSLASAATKCPEMETLKKNKVKLTPEERTEVMKAKAVWHHGADGAETPAIWKAVVKDQTWYVTNTHRAYQAKKTLKAAIKAFHDFIKSTAQVIADIEDRGKKIKCIENKRLNAEKKLTLNKIYTVLDSNENGYKIRDDINRRRFYDKIRFEIVE
jgi:hypothetical protein